MGLFENVTIIKLAMMFSLVSLALFGIIRNQTGKLTSEGKYILIVVMGCIMRIGYLLYTPCTVREHDMGEITLDACGKAAYVLQVALNHQLPPSYEFQYYQQPLFFILGGVLGRIVNFLLNVPEENNLLFLIDVSRWVSLIASCLILPAAGSLFDALKIGDLAKCIGMMLISFSPVFYLMGGRIGEDSLIILFMTLALLFTIKYEKENSWKNIIILALVYGFGMMTKISMAVPALYTAFVFLKCLRRREGRGRLLWQMGVFLAISLPIGLWFNIRNFILFGEPIGYTFKQNVEGRLYTGNYSYAERFFWLDIRNLLNTPYADPGEDYNLWTYMLKSELFGEFTYQVPIGIPFVLLFVHVIINTRIAWYLIEIVKSKEKPEYGRTLLLWYTGILAFSALSYLTNPFGCTMDYRYYAVLSVVKGLLWGQCLEQREIKKGCLFRVGISTDTLWKLLTILFAGFSVAMYLIIL